jgi:hypothetical protein
MPARKMAIRKDRIMERNTAEMKTTSSTTTKLFNLSSRMIASLQTIDPPHADARLAGDGPV